MFPNYERVRVELRYRDLECLADDMHVDICRYFRERGRFFSHAQVHFDRIAWSPQSRAARFRQGGAIEAPLISTMS
jgi:hypothetical protein